MAAPTNVSVESSSTNTATLFWTYGGANPIGVYRAPHGGSFTLIQTVASTTTSFVDTTVSSGVFYDYKLSDDNGVTFSSVVSVVVQSCPGTSGSTQSSNAPGLPQFVNEEDVNAQNLQHMVQQIEATFGTQVLAPDNCVACPLNGAVVIDCTDSCFNFIVLATTDINSITVNGCPENNKIAFLVPPGVTVGICGFPAGWGFNGQECTQSKISGGALGRTLIAGRDIAATSSPGLKPPQGTAGGGGPGGPSCACIPGGNNELTIKSCNPNNSLNCGSGAGNNSLKLIACGGVPPYTWSHSGSLQLNVTSGPSVTVKPPTNTGSGVAGSAYTKQLCFYNPTCATCNAFNFGGLSGQAYGCNDQFTSPSNGTCGIGDGSATAPCGTVADCAATGTHCANGPNSCELAAGCFNGASACTDIKNLGKVKDVRTVGQINAGCAPCGLQAGQTVSVTDFTGVTVTIVLRA